MKEIQQGCMTRGSTWKEHVLVRSCVFPWLPMNREGENIFSSFLRESWLHWDRLRWYVLLCYDANCNAGHVKICTLVYYLLPIFSILLTVINQMQWCHWWFIQTWFTIETITSKIPIQFGNNIKSFNANLYIQCKALVWMIWTAYHFGFIYFTSKLNPAMGAWLYSHIIVIKSV